MFLPSNITLKFGDSGDFVTELQRRLVLVHCFNGDAVNGFYDGMTVNAVTQFQGMSGLHADGVAGPETLRRLNGVIAGEGGSPTDTKQEAEAALTVSTHQAWLAEQAAPDTAPILDAPREEPPMDRTTAAAPAAPEPFVTEPTPMAMEMLHVPPPGPAYASAAPATSASDTLAAMLGLTSAAPSPIHTPAPEPMPEAVPIRAEVSPAPLAAEPLPMGMEARAMTPPPAPIEPTPVEPAPGLIEKAKRFTNAVVEKLAGYFEAKLPPSVLKEVQQIGMTMAQHGLKETAIPSGPELGAREQLPARGPEQQTQVQRG